MSNPNPTNPLDICFDSPENDFDVESDIEYIIQLDDEINTLQKIYTTYIFYQNTQFRILIVDSIKNLINQKAELLLKCGIISP